MAESTSASASVSFGSSRRTAVTVVGALVLWTALLGIVANLGGAYGVTTSQATVPARSYTGGGASRRHARTFSSGPNAAAEDEDEDGHWADKLLGDLQTSSTDESVSATITELRSTLAARDERRRREAASSSSSSGSQHDSGRPSSGDLVGAGLNVPRYDPTSVTELQKAALAAALPASAKGPLPQLVRDMSAAMQRQQAEAEALSKKLAQLQPSVLNYNPKDVEQLGKAKGEAVAAQGADVSGALPKAAHDLTSALKSQQEESKKLEKRMAAVTTRKARAAKRAASLRDLLLRSGTTRIEDRVSILFGELSDRATLAVEEARQGAELDGDKEGGGGGEGGGGEGEDRGRWQDTAQQLEAMIVEHLKLMAQNNASLTASRDEERQARLNLEERLKQLTTPPPPPPEGTAAFAGVASTAAAVTARQKQREDWRRQRKLRRLRLPRQPTRRTQEIAAAERRGPSSKTRGQLPTRRRAAGG